MSGLVRRPDLAFPSTAHPATPDGDGGLRCKTTVSSRLKAVDDLVAGKPLSRVHNTHATLQTVEGIKDEVKLEDLKEWYAFPVGSDHAPGSHHCHRQEL
jgi:hypothetical protein